MVTTRKPGLQRALRQRGQALLLALLVLGVAGGAMLFSYYRPATLTLESDQKTTDALALVKTALIGWTVQRGSGCSTHTSNGASWVECTGNERPGELPCPDLKAPTDINYGTAEGTCSSGRLGRVPWRTLGIPEPKDSAGETLWYAVAGPFRIRGVNDNPLNSDTQGNITVYAADGTTVLTNQAVAVIFAPGRVLGTQDRSSASAACTTSPSSPVERNRCATNYLETAGATPRNNATTNGPFINGQLSATFNDRVAYLTAPEFMPAVEKRVASEVKAWLDGYRANSTCQCYPWAARFSITPGTSPNYGTASSTGRNRGRFPVTSVEPEGWSGPRPILSSWFTYNNWSSVIYYALAKQNANQQGADCLTGFGYCTGTTLTVDGQAVISAIFFTPGTPRTGITRPSTTLADYLEDAENSDGNDDTYVTPTATALNRDRLYTSISSPAAVDTSQQCREMGRGLRRITPCGQPPRLNPLCATLAGTDLNGNVLTPPQGLQVCSAACANAARVLVNPPCQNTTWPSVCRNARETLEDC